MRLQRKGLRVIAAGAATVAVGVAVNQVLNGGKWNLVALVAATVLAILAEALNLWLGTHDEDPSPDDKPRPVLLPGLAGEDGMPRRMRDVTPRDLGVRASRFGADGDSPYIHREVDDFLAWALTGGDKRLVIVEGPRLSGATSTLARGAQIHLPDYLVAGFVDDPRVPLEDMITQADRWAADAADQAPGVVLWMDGLGPDRFSELARVPLADLPAGVSVLATLDSGVLDGLRIPEQLNKALTQHAVRIRLTAITEEERRNLRAQDVYASLRPVLDQEEDLFLGRLMVVWEPLHAALSRGDSEQATDRVALLHAVTDWYRVYLPRLLSPDVLSYLYRAYRRELTGASQDSPVSTSAFRDALEWATASPTADHPRLIDLQDIPGGQRYAPYPLLTVIADDPDEDVSWLIADALWSYTDQYFDGDQRRDIGYSALARGAYQAAARLISHADTSIDPGAYGQLAELFYEHGEWANSRDWWNKTINTGDPEHAPAAMVNLGVLELEQDDLDQARHWWLQATATDHPEHAPRAMISLGLLEMDQKDLDTSRYWFQQAAATGHPEHAPRAMINLGLFGMDQKDPDMSRYWFQQAVATGHPEHAPVAMISLGALEDEQKDVEQARYWFQQAVATGHPEHAPAAMISIGALEIRQNHRDQARDWWQRAVATDHPEHAPTAMVNLGFLDAMGGELGLAKHWFEQAAATGHPDHGLIAMLGLGFVQRLQGDLVQAEQWFLQVAATGHPDHAPGAMISLGLLEKEQGDLDQARLWFHRAIRTAHPEHAPGAMVGLGVLEMDEGNSDQARNWYGEAIKLNHPMWTPAAKYYFGILEGRQNNFRQARYWLQQIIGTGQPELIRQAAQDKLNVLDRNESDHVRAEHFNRYGYLAYADLNMMNQMPRYSDTSNPEAADHGSESDPDGNAGHDSHG